MTRLIWSKYLATLPYFAHVYPHKARRNCLHKLWPAKHIFIGFGWDGILTSLHSSLHSILMECKDCKLYFLISLARLHCLETCGAFNRHWRWWLLLGSLQWKRRRRRRRRSGRRGRLFLLGHFLGGFNDRSRGNCCCNLVRILGFWRFKVI